jgi:hypothetical protein
VLGGGGGGGQRYFITKKIVSFTSRLGPKFQPSGAHPCPPTRGTGPRGFGIIIGDCVCCLEPGGTRRDEGGDRGPLIVA